MIVKCQRLDNKLRQIVQVESVPPKMKSAVLLGHPQKIKYSLETCKYSLTDSDDDKHNVVVNILLVVLLALVIAAGVKGNR